MKINNNIKIGIGLLAVIGIYFAYKKGVFGGSEGENSASDEEPLKSSMPPSLPIVNVSSGSETPQVAVVNIPPQFGGNVVTASNIPSTAGSYQSFN